MKKQPYTTNNYDKGICLKLLLLFSVLSFLLIAVSCARVENTEDTTVYTTNSTPTNTVSESTDTTPLTEPIVTAAPITDNTAVTSLSVQAQAPVTTSVSPEEAVLGECSYTLPVGGNNTVLNTKSTQTVYENKSLDSYKKYIAYLTESAGYNKISENTIGNVYFSTFEDSAKKELLTAYYITASRIIRIISEPWHSLLTEIPAQDNAPSCTATLMQLESNPGSEQCNIIRLSDGRFVLLDTGDKESAKTIIEYLRENNVYTDGIIRIAAIFISHPHGDHVGGLKEIASKYSNEIKLDAIVLNYMSAKNQSVYTQTAFINMFSEIKSAAKKLGVVPYFARSGQNITIGDATFEIMFTSDDLGDYVLDGREGDTSRDMNNANMIVRANICGQKILFVGDSRGGQAPMIADMYKNELKCDIATVTHHGYNVNAAMILYNYAKPSVLLWPNNYYPSERAFVQNLLKASYVKEHLLGNERHILELPYTPQ